jgi:hypothetical protein
MDEIDYLISDNSINNDNLDSKLNMFDRLIIISICLIVLGEFLLGFVELIFTTVELDYSDGCYNVYKALAISGAVSFATSGIIIVLTMCIDRMKFHIEKNIQYVKKVYLLQNLKIIINIWFVIIYFMIDEVCIDFWKDNLPEILKYITINFSLFWVNLFFMLLLLISFYKGKYGQYQQIP